MQSFDLNTDTLIERHPGGVKLIQPNSRQFNKKKSTQSAKVQSVVDLLQMPFNVFFLNAEHAIQEINTPSWQSCGFQSRMDAIGHTVGRVCNDKKIVSELFEHDHQVLRQKRPLIFNEKVDKGDKGILHAISLRMPLLAEDNQEIGIFGCSAVFSDNALNHATEHLSTMINMFLAPIPNWPIKNNINFSPRENDIMQQLLRGKTSKSIASLLGLSTRTIEFYIDNMKNKTGTASKSELIEFIFENTTGN